MPDEVDQIFCNEQDATEQIAQIAVHFMQANPTEDAVNKISRMYEMLDRMIRMGDIEGIVMYQKILLETVSDYGK